MDYLEKRTFEMLMNQARIKLPGASDAGIKLELYDVMKEFMADSGAWTEDIPLTPLPNITTYSLVPQFGGQIINLVGLFDDKLIPVPAFMPQFGTLQLVNQASTVTSNQPIWTVRVTKNITLPTTRDDVPVAPDWILTVYSVHILDGLLGKMMGQQAKSYSNDKMAAYHLKRFRTGIQIARTAASRQNTKGAQAWAFPRGWVSKTQRGGVSTAWPTRAF